MTTHRSSPHHDPHHGAVAIALVALAACRADPEVTPLSAEPERPAGNIPKVVASMDEEQLGDNHPRFFLPIPLGEAPPEWPKWASDEPPPPSVIGRAIAMIDELEAGQVRRGGKHR